MHWTIYRQNALEVPADRGYTLLFAGRRSIFALKDGITEFDNETGDILWSKSDSGIVAAAQSNLMLYYARSLSGSASDTGGNYQIVALDMKTYGERWRLNLSGSRIPHLAANTTMVFVSLNPYVYALDTKTGSILWKTNVSAGLEPVSYMILFFFWRVFHESSWRLGHQLEKFWIYQNRLECCGFY